MERLGPYRLERAIGHGSVATVWRGVAGGPNGAVVAVKRARSDRSSEAIEALRREASILAEIDHPNIVEVLDVVPDGDGVALVMDLATGGSLADLLDRRGRLDPGEVVAVVAPVADALDVAHGAGLVHGDVKPENVLLSGAGRPLLADFGVARHVARPGPAVGTDGFVDPRVAAGAAPDPAADVYSLAALAWLAVAGDGVGSPLDVDPEVGAPNGDALGAASRLRFLLAAALHSDPANRPSAGELAAGLRDSVDRAAIVLPARVDASCPPPSLRTGRATRRYGPRPPRPEDRAQRRRTDVRAAVVALATLLVLLVALRLLYATIAAALSH